MRHRSPLLALLALLPALAAAQPSDVAVSASAQPVDCAVGDTVTYRAEATIHDGATQSIQATPPAFRGLTQVGQPEQTQRAAGTDTTFTFTFKLKATQPGIHVLDPLLVAYTDQRTGEAKSAGSGTVTIRVEEARTGPDIRPAKPLVEVPDFLLPYRRAALFVGCLLAASLLLAGVLKLLRRRRPTLAPSPPPLVVTADYAALRRLRDLEAEQLPERGEVDTYHVRLSEILRDYFRERYGLHALEWTTSEVLRGLHQLGLSQASLTLTRELLRGCDRVKFADAAPTLATMHGLLAAARRLIEETAVGRTPEGG